MTAEQQLLEVLRSCERAARAVCVFFRDGEAYELRIFSTAHAEVGGDVVADVVRTIHAAESQAAWDNSVMNFTLADVTRVESDDECLFSTQVT